VQEQGAQTGILSRITPLAPTAAKAKGSLEAVRLAIASGDVMAAKQSLSDLHSGRSEPTAVPPAPEVATTLPGIKLAPQSISDEADTISAPTVLALLTGRDRPSAP
jgi:hypothetical protein